MIINPTHVIFCNNDYLYLAEYQPNTQTYVPYLVKVSEETHKQLYDWVYAGGIGNLTLQLTDDLTAHFSNAHQRLLRVAEITFTTMRDAKRLGASVGNLT
jgi:hypothetical protein